MFDIIHLIFESLLYVLEWINFFVLVLDFVDWYYDHALANADFISVIKFPNKSYCLANVALTWEPQPGLHRNDARYQTW